MDKIEIIEIIFQIRKSSQKKIVDFNRIGMLKESCDQDFGKIIINQYTGKYHPYSQ